MALLPVPWCMLVLGVWCPQAGLLCLRMTLRPPETQVLEEQREEWRQVLLQEVDTEGGPRVRFLLVTTCSNSTSSNTLSTSNTSSINSTSRIISTRCSNSSSTIISNSRCIRCSSNSTSTSSRGCMFLILVSLTVSSVRRRCRCSRFILVHTNSISRSHRGKFVLV